jgi:hypothetical protein
MTENRKQPTMLSMTENRKQPTMLSERVLVGSFSEHVVPSTRSTL